MADETRPVLTLAELELETRSKGSAFASSYANLGGRLGLTLLGAGYAEVPPGKTLCPFHVHHAIDEMFVVLSGEGEYRFGEERHAVKAGDVLGAPVGGPERAHQLTNSGTEPLKYLMISSKSDMDVCEYPDSSKFAVSSTQGMAGGPNAFRYIGRADSNLDYFDGEPGARDEE